MPTDSLKSRYDNAILVRIPLLVTHMTLYLLNFLMCSIYNEYKPMLKLADLRKCESCVRVCVCVCGGGGGEEDGGGGGRIIQSLGGGEKKVSWEGRSATGHLRIDTWRFTLIQW